jgi:hypothetical protein
MHRLNVETIWCNLSRRFKYRMTGGKNIYLRVEETLIIKKTRVDFYH